jgi:hypothetical protein
MHEEDLLCDLGVSVVSRMSFESGPCFRQSRTTGARHLSQSD